MLGEYSPLSYGEVRIFFIYSYLLDFANIQEFTVGFYKGVPDDRIGMPPSILFKSDKEWSYTQCPYNNDKVTIRLHCSSGGLVATLEKNFNDIDTNGLLAQVHGVYGNANEENRIKEIIKAHGGDILGDNIIEQQNPYIVTICKLKNEPKIYWWSKNWVDQFGGQIKGKCLLWNREAFAILFLTRLEITAENLKFVRIPSDYSHHADYLKNYALSSKFLISFFPRSMLFVCHDLEENVEKPLSQSLVNLAEIMKMRSHMCTIINVLLDRKLEKFKVGQEPAKVLEDIELFQRIMNRRKQFATFLNNPIIYEFEGGSITELGKVANEKLQMGLLTELLLRKFEVIDKFYEDYMHYEALTRWVKEKKDLEAKRKGSEST